MTLDKLAWVPHLVTRHDEDEEEFVFKVTFDFETMEFSVCYRELKSPNQNWFRRTVTYTLPYDTDASRFYLWVATAVQPFLERIQAGYNLEPKGDRWPSKVTLTADAQEALEALSELFGEDGDPNSVPRLDPADLAQ